MVLVRPPLLCRLRQGDERCYLIALLDDATGLLVLENGGALEIAPFGTFTVLDPRRQLWLPYAEIER